MQRTGPARPATGQRVRPAQAVREFDGERVWVTTQSQLYGELNKPRRFLPDRGRRHRSCGAGEYRATEAGRARSWLTDPAPTPFRSAGLLRIFPLLGEMSPTRRGSYLEAFAHHADAEFERLERCANPIPGMRNRCRLTPGGVEFGLRAGPWRPIGRGGSRGRTTARSLVERCIYDRFRHIVTVSDRFHVAEREAPLRNPISHERPEQGHPSASGHAPPRCPPSARPPSRTFVSTFGSTDHLREHLRPHSAGDPAASVPRFGFGPGFGPGPDSPRWREAGTAADAAAAVTSAPPSLALLAERPMHGLAEMIQEIAERTDGV